MKKIRYVSLCSGYGAECLAFKRLKKIHPDFDFECVAWSEIERNAINAHNILHPEYADRNLGDMTTCDYGKIEAPIDVLFYSTPCFVAGTWIRTSDGLKKIEDVQKGDFVLTHTNAYQRVVKPMQRSYQGVTYELTCPLFHTLECTEEHPLYVRAVTKNHTGHREFGSPQWLSPKQMMQQLCSDKMHGARSIRQYHIGYAINQESRLPQWDGITKPCWGHTRNENKLSPLFENEPFWYLMGRYVGDGWKRENVTGNAVIICCGGRNEDKLTKAMEDCGFHYSTMEERTVRKYTIHSGELFAFVERYGYYAHGKHIDAETINLPRHLLAAFVNGVVDSDGTFKEGFYKISSVSEELIYDLGQCVAKSFHRPFSIYKTLRPEKTMIEGRLVNQRDTWTVSWKPEDAKQDRAFYEDGYIWAPIMRLAWQKARCAVYNMEVENDNSYTANGVIVHNCQSVSVAGQNKGMKKGDDTASALIWHTERAIQALRPKVCILENVKGMISKGNKPDFDQWCGVLESYGYKQFYQVLDAQSFGVPQHRERVFMVSILRTVDDPEPHYDFPKPFPLKLRLKHLLLPYGTVPESFYYPQEKVDALLAKCDDKVRALFTGAPKVMQVGNTIDDTNRTFTNPDRGRVYSPDGVAPTLKSTDYKGPTLILEEADTARIIQVGNYIDDEGRKFTNPQAGRVYSTDGVSPTLNTCGGGDREPKILEPISCAVRGRSYRGQPQKIELRDGVANCITSVEKDSLVAEPSIQKVANVYPSGGQGGVVVNPDGIAPTVCECHGEVTRIVEPEPMVSAHPWSHAHENPTPRADVAPTLRATDYKCPPVAYEPTQYYYRIRKLHPIETYRLQDVDDEDIAKLMEAEDDKGKPLISKSRHYALCGNSITISVLQHIFTSLFYPENAEQSHPTLFDQPNKNDTDMNDQTNNITIQKVLDEKAKLQESIKAAVQQFYEATGFPPDGEFDMDESIVRNEMGGAVVRTFAPRVIIRPIEI